MDEEGDPLPDVPIGIRGTWRTTDAAGRAEFSGVGRHDGSSLVDVKPPWLILNGSTSGPVLGREQTRLVYLGRSCPGLVRILDEGGEPVADAELPWWTSQSAYARRPDDRERDRTNGAGEVFIDDRPCGPVRFEVWLRDRPWTPPLAGVVEGEEPLQLRLPALNDAVLLVVDSTQAPQDAEVRSIFESVEAVGPGRFRIRGRRSIASLRVRAERAPEQSAVLPLDGQEHVYTLSAGRDVELTLLCEDCPEKIACANNRCEGSGESWFCPCPEGQAWISQIEGTVGSTPLAQVPSEVEALTIDLRPIASIQGRWAGPLPCSLSIYGDRPSFLEQTCEADGSFLIEDVVPGRYTLNVWHGRSAESSVLVELHAEEILDVGEIHPTLPVHGLVDSPILPDIEHIGATPGGSPTLDPDGLLTINGLPADAHEVELIAWSQRHGLYTAVLPIGPDGTLPVWYIDPAAIHNTESLESWIAADTGYNEGNVFLLDTGNALLRDTGEADSGWP